MKVLIVDDERNIRESLKKFLSLEDIDSSGAETGEEARELLEGESFDAIVLDLKLPGISGQDLLEWIQERGILAPVIMISAHGEIADAVEALKSGAKDYLTKPFDPAELIIKLKALVDNRRRENMLEAERRTAGPTKSFIGGSPAMAEISSQIDRVAAGDVTVMITGESGTGKEVAALEIHRRGGRGGEPFVAVNIGGIHENLMESELFGHEKGAFTGAAARKQGLFELAGRGTLFLDEIGEMPAPLQVKLLRVLQERKIRRLGGTSDIPVNARIISATNKNPEELVRGKVFREDLYYRLNVFRIELPPLRERPEDIPLLAEHLLARSASRMGRPKPVFSSGAMEALMSYSYPGNVRELENILERTLIYCSGGEIRGEDIELPELRSSPERRTPAPRAAGPAEVVPGGLADGDTGSPEKSFRLEEIERQAIADALRQWKGNRTKAAEALGISRKTIINKINAYGLD